VTTPEQSKPTPKTTQKPKSKISLDHDMIIQKVVINPDLSPRTFVLPKKLLDT
jgi:hypothetical protein